MRETVAQFALRVGDVCLTQNEDIWSRTVRDNVLVSLYPLAMWLTASWWRLHYEPLPKHGSQPSTDWRLGHELGAANHGYVWPHILMASDGEAMQIWAVPSDPKCRQSVRYLTGLQSARSVPLTDFRNAVDEFIEGVLERLRASGHAQTDLAGLWGLVLEDRSDPEHAKVRKIEAQMGFDPEECPDSVIAQALELEQRMGSAALSELAPVYGKRGTEVGLTEISEFADSDGLMGRPEIKRGDSGSVPQNAPPWQRAAQAARNVRRSIGETTASIENQTLYGLLGLSANDVEEWTPASRNKVGMGIPNKGKTIKFLPRKRHPIAKRFEFARFLADHVGGWSATDQWLASTDLATSRQKFQRAFAAEFLCPITSVVGFLGGDFSEPAIEEAAAHYGVSDQTVESLLSNNGYIAPRQDGGWMPYRVAGQQIMF
jgi:hypothetical protein